MVTLKFICKCDNKSDCMKFGRLMQRLGVKWLRTEDLVTANTVRCAERSTIYFVREGHLQRGGDYELVKSYAKNRGCIYEVSGRVIDEFSSVEDIKRLYHEI